MSSHHDRITILLIGGVSHNTKVEIYTNSETCRVDKDKGMFDMYTRRYFDRDNLITDMPVFAEKSLTNEEVIDLLKEISQ